MLVFMNAKCVGKNFNFMQNDQNWIIFIVWMGPSFGIVD